MSTKRSWNTSSAVLALLAVVCVVAVAELALRVLSPVANPYDQLASLKPQINQYIRFEYPRNYSASTEVEDGLPGMSGSHSFTTNNMGFRGDSLLDPKPPKEFRIFMVGGSTTECFYIDDQNDLSRVVERELSSVAPPGVVVRVYNAGLSGAASDDHVASISQRIVHFQPDLVVVFCGINDLLRSIYHYDYRHYVEYRPAYRKPWYKRWSMHLQITRRILLFRQRINPDARRLQEQRTLVTNYHPKIRLQRDAPVTDDPPRTDERSYATNLRTLAGIAKANDFELVFMTQQTTWNSAVDPEARNYHWMRYRAPAPERESDVPETGVTFREDLMDLAMERLNDRMRGVAVEDSVPLYDLARTLPKSLQYFYDDCHFNTLGAATAAQGLAAFMIERRLFPKS